MKKHKKILGGLVLGTIVLTLGVKLFRTTGTLPEGYQIPSTANKGGTDGLKQAAHAPTPRIYPRATKIKHTNSAAFFKKLGTERIGTLKFSTECEAELAHVDPTIYTDYLSNKTEHDANTKRYESQIKQQYFAPSYIQWVSDEVGYGLFCSEARKPGDLIAEYVGEVTPSGKSGASTFNWRYPTKGEFIIGGEEKHYSINANHYRSELAYINDGDVNNVRVKFVYANNAWRVLYVACRPIQPGDQFLISYGKKYWRRRQKISL